QLAQVARVGAVGLRPPLPPPLADEQPAGAGLDRDLDPLAAEARDPAPDGRRARIDPAATQLPRLRVERVEGDLLSVHVESGYDRHRGLLRAPCFSYRANDLAPSQGRPYFMPSCDGGLVAGNSGILKEWGSWGNMLSPTV